MKSELVKEMFQINMKLTKIRRDAFDRSDLMPRSEYILLYHINELAARDERQTISQVATELHLSNAAISRTIKQLLAKKWLTRETLAEDRRNCIVKISQEGQKHFDEITTRLNELVDDIFQDISMEELEQFLTIGQRIVTSLS